MLLHALMDCSLVNGPGRRTVLWFQGCELRCEKCWNTKTHSRHAGTLASSSELVTRILAAHARHDTEGVTLSGGEPIHQIGSIVEMLTLLKERAPVLSVGLFSGYSERELKEGRFQSYEELAQRERCTAWRNLRGLLEFAILGRFNQHQASSSAMLTSRNQQLRIYSGRYAEADFLNRAVEVTIDPDGFTQITGFPTLGAFG
jgi:anaerobic ribonucleoside-triphosphate reductase activating protein